MIDDEDAAWLVDGDGADGVDDDAGGGGDVGDADDVDAVAADDGLCRKISS